MARRRVTLAQHHRRWAIWVTIVAFVAAAGIAGMAFAREGAIAREPWGYVFLAVAIVAAVAGMIMTFAQAVFESND